MSVNCLVQGLAWPELSSLNLTHYSGLISIFQDLIQQPQASFGCSRVNKLEAPTANPVLGHCFGCFLSPGDVAVRDLRPILAGAQGRVQGAARPPAAWGPSEQSPRGWTNRRVRNHPSWPRSAPLSVSESGRPRVWRLRFSCLENCQVKDHARGFVSLTRNSSSFSVDGRLVRPLQSVRSRGLKGNWWGASWSFQRSLKREEVSLGSLWITVRTSVEMVVKPCRCLHASLLSDPHAGFPEAVTPWAAAVWVCKGHFLHCLWAV